MEFAYVKDGEHGDHTRGHAHHKEHQRTEVSDDNRFCKVEEINALLGHGGFTLGAAWGNK